MDAVAKLQDICAGRVEHFAYRQVLDRIGSAQVSETVLQHCRNLQPHFLLRLGFAFAKLAKRFGRKRELQLSHPYELILEE